MSARRVGAVRFTVGSAITAAALSAALTLTACASDEPTISPASDAQEADASTDQEASDDTPADENQADDDGSSSTTTSTTIAGNGVWTDITTPSGEVIPAGPATTIPTPPPDDPITAEYFLAYRKASEAYFAALALGDPDYPALAETMWGPHLEQIRGVVAERVRQGVVARLAPDTQARLRLEQFHRIPGSAYIEVCEWDDSFGVITTTGEKVNEGLGIYRLGATLQEIDGTLKVVHVHDVEDGAEC